MAREINFKFRLSDPVLFIYIAAVTRQFLWGIPGQTLTWMLTTVVSVVILATHAYFREAFIEPDSKRGTLRKLTLVAFAAPLVVVFLVRTPFPEYNHDVLNYHLVYMERALRGWPFIPGDFFPSAIQFNPTANIATGICKYLLGFRLGHLINVAAVLWTASLAERFLRDSIGNEYLRRLGALVVVSTELILFLQTTYLVDLLALPLLLEAMLLATNFKSVLRKRYSLVHIGLFLGISLAFKISNMAFIVPIGVLTIYQAYVGRKEFLWPALAGMMAAVVTPALPFFIFMFIETGNPVFPLYNRVFRSPYWTLDNLATPGFGPQNILQTLFWPFWVYTHPEPVNDFLGVDRIALALIFAAVSLLMPRLRPSLKLFGLVTASSILLWSALSGNLRYGIFAEVLGGILILSVLASLLSRSRDHGEPPKLWNQVVLALSFSAIFAMQVFISYRAALTFHRMVNSDNLKATIFEDPSGYLHESAYLFRDRSMKPFLNSEEQRTVDGIDVWVNSYPLTVGMMVSLKPEIPIIAVTGFSIDPWSYDPLKTAASRERYEIARQAAAGKHLYSITYEGHLDETLGYLKRAGLRPTRIQKWQLPYYSTYTRMNMLLIELENVAPNQSNNNTKNVFPRARRGEPSMLRSCVSCLFTDFTGCDERDVETLRQGRPRTTASRSDLSWQSA